MNAPIKNEVLEQSTSLVDVHIAEPKPFATNLVVIEAENMIVDSAFMFEECGEQLKSLTAMERAIEEQRKELVKPINESHTKIQAFFKKHSDPVQQAISILKRKYMAYQSEQKRIADEAQRLANIEAEKERSRLAVQAAAAQKLADELAAQAVIIPEGITDEQAEAQAAKIVEANARVEELQVQAAMTVAAVVSEAPAKVTGISSRQNWKYEITDLSLVPREYLMIDEKKISGVVKAMKAETKISGIRAYPDLVLATRIGT